MSLRFRALRGAAVLTVGQGLGQALAFGRNAVISHMLLPEQVGIAATLAITLSLIELLADVSVDKLLIQAKDGEAPELQAACQAALALRGLVQAVLLVLCSWPLAAFFDLRGLEWAFQCVAIGPLLRGFGHLDVTRLQRELHFMPSAIAELLPQIVAFAAIFPLAHWFNDYRVVLFGTLLQAGIYVACTHVLARRPYRWTWDGVTLRRIAHFGWPLMINGALLFAINQGDRVAIGGNYPKPDLALWSNAMLLASAPLLILGKVAVSMALPILAKCRDDRALFDSRYELCMQGLAWVAAVVAVPLVLGGGAMMALAFGEPYSAGGTFIGVLAASQACRVCRIGPTVAALAHGETTNAAYGNAARLVGVGGAALFAMSHSPLLHVALAGFCGELLSFLVGAVRLQCKGVLKFWQSTLPMLPVAALIGIGVLAARSGLVAERWSIGFAAAGGLLAGGLLLLPFHRLRQEPSALFRSLRGVRA